ncbi:MAG: TIR domain-containing protein [Sphingomicrobium sp.]
MGRIFLSYAREDRPFAERLACVLEKNGHEVWWDRRIDGGEEFSTEIEAALDNADVVVVAWSARSITSRWVRDEAASGGDRGRLVPVTIDGARPPMGFRQFHTLDLAGWKGAGGDERTRELVRSVERRLQGKAAIADAPPPPRQRGFAWPLGRPVWVIGAALLLLVVAGAAYFLKSREARSRGTSRPTLAIMPFTATSPDPALKSLASQARDSTAHDLSDSGIPVRLVESVTPDSSPTADYLLFGELGGSGGKVVATVRLEEARQHVTVWSRRFEAEGKKVSDLPDQIGAQVAGTLGWAGALRTLDRGQVADPNLIADLMRQMDLTGDPLQSYQLSKGLLAKWPNSAMAQLGVAFYTAFALGEIPRAERPAAVAAARQAAERAQALMPEFGDTYIPSCILQPEVRIAQCEDRLRAGMRTDPDAPFANAFLARLLDNGGRTGESFEMARQSYVHDPYMPEKIGFMIRMLTVTGKDTEADRLYQRAIGWWPDSGLLFSRVWGLVERGDFKAIMQLRDQLGPKDFSDYAGIATVAQAVRAKSLSELNRSCESEKAGWLQKEECMLAFAQLGDLDRAYAVADQIYPARIAATASEEELRWLDDPDSTPLNFITSRAAGQLRLDPRYAALAQRVGLLSYWRGGKLPDFCRSRPEPVCPKLQS